MGILRNETKRESLATRFVKKNNWLHSENLSDPANNGVGSRSEWMDLTSENHPGDEALRRKDREGKVIWDQRLPVKILVRKKRE